MNSSTEQPTTKQERVYKTPEYIRKAVKAYADRQKATNKEQFLARKRDNDKKYREKFKKIDNQTK